MTLRKVERKGDAVEAVPNADDLAKLKIEKVYTSYYAYILEDSWTNKKDKSEHVYKLHQIPGTKRFVWLAMWNSCVWTSMGVTKKHSSRSDTEGFDSMESAIKAALDKGYKVLQINQDGLLRWVLDEMRRA